MLRGITSMVSVSENVVAKKYKLERCLFNHFSMPFQLED
jgi:hypothetical protein